METRTASVRQNLIFQVAGVFLIWTVTSFLCHDLGKTFLELIISRMNLTDNQQHYTYDWQPGLYATCLLSAFQLGLFYLSLEMKSNTFPIQSLAYFTCHALATFSTNLSMAETFAASTFAFKLMEPLTSALVQYVIVGTSLSLATILSLPIIIGGAITFTGNPFCNSGSTLGLVAALASNVFLSFRNVTFKQIQQTERETKILRSRCVERQQHVVYGAMGLLGTICVCFWFLDINRSIALAYLSGIFHVLYSYTSMACALQRLSVVTHAIVNISKRVFVVLLLYIVGQRQASASNFFGLVVCTIGLFLYTWDRYKPNEKVKDKNTNSTTSRSTRITLLACMVITFFLGIVFCNIMPSLRPLNKDQTPEKQVHASDLLVFSKSSQTPLDQRFETRTFSRRGLTRPSDEMLMPRLGNLSNAQAESVADFLNLDLMQYPRSANRLINQMKSHRDIIREAQRIQFNVLGNLLGKYKYAIWVAMAAFENKGDSCISTGEAILMKRLGIEIIFFCHFTTCTIERLKEARVLAEKYSPQELVILNRGGGNLVGYFQNDKIRFMLLDLFQGYHTVVLPQGIWVRNDDLNTLHVQRCVKNYCCNPNLTIILRDRASYELSKKIFKGSTNLLLAPDTAFQIGPIPRIMNPTFDIIWQKRNDLEGTPNFTLPAHPPNLRVHLSQWDRWKTPSATTKIESAYYICTNGFLYLQRARVLVTDRLHGHIVSILANIPHVVIDPKGRKITNFHNTWTKSYDRVSVARDPEEAMSMALDMLKKYDDILQPRLPFLHLREGTSQEKKADKHPEKMP